LAAVAQGGVLDGLDVGSHTVVFQDGHFLFCFLLWWCWWRGWVVVVLLVIIVIVAAAF